MFVLTEFSSFLVQSYPQLPPSRPIFEAKLSSRIMAKIYLLFLISGEKYTLKHAWMDDLLICDFTSFLTVFQSNQDDGGVGGGYRLCAMEHRLQLRKHTKATLKRFLTRVVKRK